MRRTLPNIDVVWLAMPLFVVVIRTLLQPVTPEDYWFALAFGDAIRLGDWPNANVFMYPVPADAPWYAQAWLAQWAMASLADHVGHLANYFAHVALLVAAWLLLLRFGVRRGAAPLVLGIAAAATHYMAANGLMVRTQMFAYPLFVAFLGLLLRQLDDVNPRRWAILVAITVVWSNVHGTFVFAPLLTGAGAIGVCIGRWRRRDLTRSLATHWGLPLVGVTAATMVSPGGFDNLLYPLTIATATKGETFVVEWVPPAILSPQGGLFWFLLVASIGFAIWQRKRFSIAELLLFGLVSIITVTSVRAILWWGFTFTLLFAPKISELFADRLRRDDETSTTSGISNTAILVAFVTTCAAALPGAPLFEAVDTTVLYGRDRLQTDDPDLRIFSAENPVQLAGKLLDETDGRLFHHQHAGGLLEYLLIQKRGSLTAAEPRIFIDQRIELTTPEQWQQYFDLSRAKHGWAEVLDRYDVAGLLLHPSEQVGLIEALEGSEAYEQIGESGSERDRWVVFLRRDKEASPRSH